MTAFFCARRRAVALNILQSYNQARRQEQTTPLFFERPEVRTMVFQRLFFISAILTAVFLWGQPLSAAPVQAETAAGGPAGQPTEIQKSIAILEDAQRRQEMITLLKLLDTLDQEKARAVLAQAEAEEPEAASPGDGEVEGRLLSGLVEGVWRDVSVSWSGLRQSWRSMKNVFTSLETPTAVEMWRPYLLKIFGWGLFCLLAAFLVIKKFGRLPEACHDWDFKSRFRTAVKYILIVAGPNLVLILSLLALPQLSTTERGVTADLAIGFSFIYAFIRHFFINLSMLYISLEMIKVLFTPGRDGHCLVNIHPVLARHLTRSLRVFSVYLTGLVFSKDTFMEHFAVSSLYPILLVVLTLPIPIYLTARLTKLRRLVHTVSEAEASAALADEPDAAPGRTPAPPRPRLDYQVNLLLKRHWAPLSIIAVWGLWLLSLIHPVETSERFAGQFVICMILLGLSALGVAFSRRVMLRFVSQDTESGRRFLLYADLLINALVWLAWSGAVVTVWGLPLERLLENAVVRDILGRAGAIAVVIAALAVFVRFSRVATDWLLSSPDLAKSRNWRTMTPLVLTAVRALAVFSGVVVILDRLGVNIGPILAGAGILGLGVGMGAQSLVKDVINGISILLMDTLSVGDYVTIGGKSGTVEIVGLRSIRLRDSAGNLTVVPNSMVDTIVNMTRDYSQDLIEFTVPCDADPDAMLQMTREVADDLSGDSDWKKYLTSPVAVVGVTAFDANGTTIRLKINTTAGDQWAVGRELRLRLKRRMLRDGLKSTWFGQNVFYFRGQDDDPEPPLPAGGQAPA